MRVLVVFIFVFSLLLPSTALPCNVVGTLQCDAWESGDTSDASNAMDSYCLDRDVDMTAKDEAWKFTSRIAGTYTVEVTAETPGPNYVVVIGDCYDGDCDACAGADCLAGESFDGGTSVDVVLGDSQTVIIQLDGPETFDPGVRDGPYELRVVCPSEIDCDDGLDGDGDGAADCDDPDCLGQTCIDGLDCTTSDVCVGVGSCSGTPDSGRCVSFERCDTTDGCVPSECPEGPPCASCSDLADNDGDLAVDCDDADCAGASCDDGVACTLDDVCDGAGGCQGTPASDQCDTEYERCDVAEGCVLAECWLGNPCDGELVCNDGICGECVPDCTSVDCGDDGCGGSCGDCDLAGYGGECNDGVCIVYWCTEDFHCPGGYSCTDHNCVPIEICGDGFDNDGDSQVDCEDVDCCGQSGCEAWCDICPEICNGVDDYDCDTDIDNEAVCDDGLECTTDSCDSTCQFDLQAGFCLIDGACVADGEAESPSSCLVCDTSMSTSAWSQATPGAGCDDGLNATHTDQCDDSGVCAGTPYECTPVECEDVVVPDGTGCVVVYYLEDTTPCEDGDLCTEGETCSGTVCTNGQPVQCLSPPVCRQGEGTCYSDQGCIYDPVTDGGDCDDGDLCTIDESCQGGECVPTDTVTCGPAGECQTGDGTCNPDTGLCEYASIGEGELCDDGDACTTGEVCTGGVCGGGDETVCPPPAECKQDGVCNTSTGVCEYTDAPDGTDCSDDDACTQTDACSSGACVGSDDVVCAPPGQCRQEGVCNSLTGDCEYTNLEDGTPCDDFRDCTGTDDYCSDGVCIGDGVCAARTIDLGAPWGTAAG